MSTPHINPEAQSARENARDPQGRFGTHAAGESAATLVPESPTAEARQAVSEKYDRIDQIVGFLHTQLGEDEDVGWSETDQVILIGCGEDGSADLEIRCDDVRYSLHDASTTPPEYKQGAMFFSTGGATWQDAANVAQWAAAAQHVQKEAQDHIAVQGDAETRTALIRAAHTASGDRTTDAAERAVGYDSALGMVRTRQVLATLDEDDRQAVLNHLHHEGFDTYDLDGQGRDMWAEEASRADQRVSSQATGSSSDPVSGEDPRVQSGQVFDAVTVEGETYHRRRPGTYPGVPSSIRIQADRRLTDEDRSRLASQLGYAYATTGGEPLGDPEADSDYSFVVSADTTKGRAYRHLDDRFEEKLPGMIAEGSPVRKTDKAGPGTAGTRLVEGFGDDAPHVELYYDDHYLIGFEESPTDWR